MDINKEEDTKTSKNIGFASGLQSLSDALIALVEQASPSVVSLASVIPDAGRRRWGRFGLGTGVVLSEDEGHIISNSHVVHRAQEAEVGLPSGETARAKVVGRDAESDLALLKLESKVGSLKSIQFGDSDQLKVGQFVIAVARAFGADPSATSGIITSSRRSIRGGVASSLRMSS
ncbi:MAG TPA: trypsin-like peptidase domain-containing protein [Nitrososphaerales archaeon]|nr:trypsin-like peptidase domain-containing protein [Nitrososphaerales archaeon]